MKGHSGSVKAITQHCMLSATKQAISMTLATTVGHFFYMTSCLQTFIWLDYLVYYSRKECLVSYIVTNI